MRQLLLFFVLFLPSLLFSQNRYFKSAVVFDTGLRVYGTDLGLGGGLDLQAGGLFYNTNSKRSPVVFSARVIFNNFSAEDNQQTQANRELFGGSVGFGLHLKERLFGTVNLAFLTLLNKNSIVEELDGTNTFLGTGRLSGKITDFEGSSWSLMLHLEGGFSFRDIEFLDRGAPDIFTGTGFGAFRVGMIKIFGQKPQNANL